jgi:2-methylcitrate dehydratase PrpD
MDIASDLVDYAVNLNFNALPGDVVDRARIIVLDALGAIIVGSTGPGIERLVDMVREWGGKPESRLVIFGDKVPVTHAAWINGAMARAHDFDDFHEKAILHGSASTVPATLAIAEKVGRISGKEFLCAVVLGMDKDGCDARVYRPSCGRIGSRGSQGGREIEIQGGSRHEQRG